MRGLKEIFTCCGGTPSDPQIVINMEQKHRSSTWTASDKRTFIKRSIGKNPILDLSIKHTNKSTENTPKAKSALKIKRIRDQTDDFLLQNSFDHSIQNVQKNKIGKSSSSVHPNTRRQASSNREKMQKFINYSQYNQKQFENFLLPNNNQQIFQLYEPSQLRRTNFYERRINKHKQDLNQRMVLDVQNKQLMKTMKTIIEAIDERSSIPSMQESQMNQMRQISSKATIKSHIYDRYQTKNSQSPFTTKYQSMIIKENSSKQSLRMANSQNLFNGDQRSIDEFAYMALSKLEMENSIALKELKALEEEQKFLRHQKQFQYERFDAQIKHIGKIRGEYAQKLSQTQIQLNQIKQNIGKKETKTVF